MNGRIYDPVLGRFLSVDPVIQAPDYSQSFNGYSYCLNNPLKYVDPDGFNAAAVTIAKENWAKLLAQAEYFNLEDLSNLYKSHEESSITKFLNFLTVWLPVDNADLNAGGGGGSAGIFGGTRKLKDIANLIRYSVFSPLPIIPIFNPIAHFNPFFMAEALLIDGGISHMAGELDEGIAFVLAGNDKGKWAFYDEISGGGSDEFGISEEVTRIDYWGNLSGFDIFTMEGNRYKGFLGEELLGGAFSFTKESDYLLTGFTFQSSFTAELFGFSFGGNLGKLKIRR